MERKLVHDDENVFGYSSEIAEEVKEVLATIDDEEVAEPFIDLLEQLEQYDYELVYVRYEVMDGSYEVNRLIEEIK